MNGKYLLPILVLGLAALLSACTGGYGTGPGGGSNSGSHNGMIDIDLLTQHWVNSYEEETGDGVLVYRVFDFAQVPPSRFRMEYLFYPDFTCQWLYLDPADAHHLRPGTWKLDQNLLSVNQDGVIVSYRILELTSDLLRMTRIS